MVLSKERPLLAFSEEMPSSFQTFGEKHPLEQQSSRHWKLSCGVLPPPGAALPGRDPTLFVTPPRELCIWRDGCKDAERSEA